MEFDADLPEKQTPKEPPKHVVDSHVRRLREQAQLEYVVESSRAADEGEHQAPAGLSDEPPEETAVIEDTDEEPPEPAFLIVPNKFGPKVDGVYFPDGTPVGVWLADKHPLWKAEHVLINLIKAGLDGVHAEQFARRRAMRDGAQVEFDAMLESAPADSPLRILIRSELERDKKMEPIRAAFIKSKGEKT